MAIPDFQSTMQPLLKVVEDGEIDTNQSYEVKQIDTGYFNED